MKFTVFIFMSLVLFKSSNSLAQEKCAHLTDEFITLSNEENNEHEVRWGSELGTQLKKNHIILNSNRFPVARDDYFYQAYLGIAFEKELRSLPLNSHYLDSGAGSALATFRYATRSQNQLLSQKITAVALVKPEINYAKIPGREFRYLEGRYIEDIPAAEIGAVDLIADLYGPFSYTASIDLVLKKYLQILKLQGSVFINFNSQIITIDNHWEGLGRYLNSISGAKVEWVEYRQKGAGAVIRVTKTSDAFNVPKLFLENFEAGEFDHPQRGPLPVRRYRSL
jgi:hypothetical protein